MQLLAVDEMRGHALIPGFLDPKRGQAQPYRQETLSRLSVCLSVLWGADICWTGIDPSYGRPIMRAWNGVDLF